MWSLARRTRVLAAALYTFETNSTRSYEQF